MDGREEIVERVLEALKSVYDPEIPVNIVDLGLVYGVDVDENNNVRIRMTLTAPGCPVAGFVAIQAEEAVKEKVPEARKVEVQFVWEPPWTPDRISEDGRRQLKAMFGYDVVEEWKRRMQEVRGG